mgnify:CR=1 FL=1
MYCRPVTGAPGIRAGKTGRDHRGEMDTDHCRTSAVPARLLCGKSRESEIFILNFPGRCDILVDMLDGLDKITKLRW